MTREDFLRKMVGRERITQEQADAVVAKGKALDEALDEYMDKCASLTKAQMQAILDKAVAAKAPKAIPEKTIKAK